MVGTTLDTEVEEVEEVADVVGFAPGVVPFSRPGNVIVTNAASVVGEGLALLAEIEDVGRESTYELELEYDGVRTGDWALAALAGVPVEG
jgi:hypothetical protein